MSIEAQSWYLPPKGHRSFASLPDPVDGFLEEVEKGFRFGSKEIDDELRSK